MLLMVLQDFINQNATLINGIIIYSTKQITVKLQQSDSQLVSPGFGVRGHETNRDPGKIFQGAYVELAWWYGLLPLHTHFPSPPLSYPSKWAP